MKRAVARIADICLLASNIEVLDLQRVLYNELLARLGGVAHQRRALTLCR